MQMRSQMPRLVIGIRASLGISRLAKRGSCLNVKCIMLCPRERAVIAQEFVLGLDETVSSNRDGDRDDDSEGYIEGFSEGYSEGYITFK